MNLLQPSFTRLVRSIVLIMAFVLRLKKIHGCDIMKDIRTFCSICNGTFKGHGHNAMPINNGRCCDNCNFSKVLPARMINYMRMKKFREEFR